MSDLQYIMALSTLILIGMAFIGLMEWYDPIPKDWVVKVRMWLNRRKW